VRAYGTDVVLLQPTSEDLVAMGRNLMSPERRDDVIVRAQASVTEQLQSPRVRELLAGLPEGEPHKLRRPEGPPSEWPAIGPALEGSAPAPRRAA